MAYFEWARDLVIDDGPIDADHRQLVDLVNRLHDATSQGQGQDIVGEILTALVDYTREHLQREEALMAQHGFANLEDHKVWHRAFVDQLTTLETRYQGGSIAVAALLSSVLRDWLSLHIRRSDKELREYLARRR